MMDYFSSNIKSKIIVLLFLTVPSLFAFSQTAKLDSLKNSLDEQENDTVKVKVLLQYADALTQQMDIEKALYYYKQAKTLSNELNYSKGSVKSNYGIGLYYAKYKHEPDSSLPYANRAIAISDSIHDLQMLNKSYRLKLNCYHQKDDLTTMKYYSLKCLQISRELNDSIGIGKVYTDLGIIQFVRGNYDSAAFDYMKAIYIYENTGSEQSLGNSYINLAQVFVKTNDDDLAEKYLLRALGIEDKLWRRTYIPIVYDNLGLIRFDKKEFKKAIEYFDLGIRYALESNYRSEYAYLLVNKSAAQRKLGLFFEAKENSRMALELSRKLGSERIEYGALTGLAKVYAAQGEYQKAIEYYKMALIAIRDINVPESRQTIFENLSLTYETLGDYKNAFLYQSKYYQLNDSLFSVEKMEAINDLELKYQKKENEAKILGLENENLKKDISIREKTIQSNIIFYTALGIFLFLILLFAFYRQRINKNRIIAEQQIKQLEEEKKLLAARSLVEGQEEERKRIAKDLHDGIGVLLSTAKMQFTALQSKIPENKDLVDKAGKLLEQASVDVRRISHNMMPGLLTKYGLNEALGDLFEQLDETPGLSAKVDANEDTKRLAENQEIMLYRIIQELVNNTLKHAAAKNISLNLNFADDTLNLHYADDGVGFEMNKQPESVSIGLKGIESRVSFLGGEVNMESDMGKGFRCQIIVPVEYR